MVRQQRWMLLLAFLIAGFVVRIVAQTSPPNDQTNWWAGEGTAADIAGSSDGSLQGNVMFPQGVVGRAFGFDGNSYVSVVDNASLDLAAAGSVSLWLFLNTGDGGQSIFYKGAVDTNAASYGWSTYEGLLRFDLYRGDGSANYVNLFMPVTDVAGRWTHLVATWDGSILKVYKDGQLNTDHFGRTSVSYTHFARLDTPYALYFGSDHSQRNCSCSLDEIQTYARALSSSEVASAFAQDRTIALLSEVSHVISTIDFANDGHKNSLMSTLEAAQRALAGGRDIPAVNQLRAFIQHVMAFQDAGKLDAGNAGRLISSAQEIISRIEN